jgi:RimJ/RimL family protein N-acetyltransferase
MIVIRSQRLQLAQFQMIDAQEVFKCITPAVTKFIPWEPPSWSEYVARCERRVESPEPTNFSFVVRRLDNEECLGIASFEDAESDSPELGLWLKESAQEQGLERSCSFTRCVGVCISWQGKSLKSGSDKKYR